MTYYAIPGSSLEPVAAPGLVVLGGLSQDGPLSSAETFGFEDDDCSVPQLPEARYGLAAFLTLSVLTLSVAAGGRASPTPPTVSRSIPQKLSG